MAKTPMPFGPSPDYQAQDDTRTMEQAHEIMTTPKRHAAMKKHAAKKLAGLKHAASSKPMRGGRY